MFTPQRSPHVISMADREIQHAEELRRITAERDELRRDVEALRQQVNEAVDALKEQK